MIAFILAAQLTIGPTDVPNATVCRTLDCGKLNEAPRAPNNCLQTDGNGNILGTWGPCEAPATRCDPGWQAVQVGSAQWCAKELRAPTEAPK